MKEYLCLGHFERMKKIVIIGGGISGLAVLHYLKQRFKDYVEITLYERNSQVGGTIGTLDFRGFLFETGPNGFLTNQPNTLEFLQEIGLATELIEANVSAKRRYIQLGGQLKLLPMDLVSFLKSDLLSNIQKFRMFQGLFLRNTPKDQSIYDYTTKRFGVAVTERFVDPFLTGVYAGDIKSLHMQWAFPKMGSKNGKPKLYSFKNGMGSLIQHLSKKYAANVKLESEINDFNQIEADIKICCTPAYVAANLLKLDILKEIPYSPIAVIGLAFDKAAFKKIPDGFGYLIPSTEGKDVLGVLLESNVFERKTKENQVFLRVMLGGRHHPEILNLSKEQLLDKAIKELDQIYGLSAKPLGTAVKIWPQAIPQYELNYPNIRQELKKYLETTSSIYLCANYLDGISFNDCIYNAKCVVNRISI